MEINNTFIWFDFLTGLFHLQNAQFVALQTIQFLLYKMSTVLSVTTGNINIYIGTICFH